MKKILSIVISFLFLLTSCAPTASSRYDDRAEREATMTVQDERRLTQEALPKILKDYPPAQNNELQKYVSQLGMKIVKANNLEGNPYSYSFTVVDVVAVNAFAMPAGTIFITAPLIAMAQTEAELAGVISHEIGHVVARHTAKRMYAMEKAQNKTWLYAAGGGLIGAAAGLGLALLICGRGDTECLAKAAAIGGVVGAGGGMLAQQYGFLVNSREDEMEADRIGFQLAVNAGYDRNEVGRFYERLWEIEKKSQASASPIEKRLSDAFSTHPPSKLRVQQMEELAAQSPAKKGTVNTAGFNRAKKMASDMPKK
ncbi:MAG TPA: hypothetical protein ENN23_07990 [Deltaproteobacteria bacterium]|nr:hypothetical protein [Deltaproteobacteria bacterium]